MKKGKRRIVYVDASLTDDICKISLYDSENNVTKILELVNIKNSNKAEKYAVIYATLYIIENQYVNCHILSDNLSATQDKKIEAFTREKNISISWIPREVNVVADGITKLPPTVDIKKWYILDTMYQLIFRQGN